MGQITCPYFGDVDSVPNDEWINAEMEDGADFLLQYAVQGETIYYRLLGDNDDVGYWSVHMNFNIYLLYINKYILKFIWALL